MFTTSEMSPDGIHSTGISEVERIQSEILEILSGEEFYPELIDPSIDKMNDRIYFDQNISMLLLEE